MSINGCLWEQNTHIKLLNIYLTSLYQLLAICDTITMNPDNVLILKDAESVCSCVAKQVMVENGECVVKTGTFDMANVLWDGMALIESAGKGMILLRNLFLKPVH